MRNFYYLLFLFSSVFVWAQNICDIEVNPVCSTETFDVQAPNSSYDGAIESCDGISYPLENVVWYEMRVLEGSTFTFLIELNLGDDYDFALWKNPNCEDLGVPDRATFIHEPLFGITTTGLMLNEEDECESFGDFYFNTPGFVRHLDVVPGDMILLMIQRPEVTSSGYDFNIQFENTGGDAVLDCSIVGNIYPKCDVDGNGVEDFLVSDFLNDLATEYPNSVYSFYTSHIAAFEGDQSGLVSFPFSLSTFNSPEFLFIRIEDADGTFDRVIQISLVVNPIPFLDANLELEFCDNDFSGQFMIDLSDLETELIDNSNQYQFSFYQSLAQAISQENPISDNQVNSYLIPTLPHSVWVVATNVMGCHSLPIQVQFMQGEMITLNSETVVPLEYCKGESIDLTYFEGLISSDSGLTYTYFESLANAQENQNSISNITDYLAQGNGEIYIRLEHANLCPVIAVVEVLENPIPKILNLPTLLEVCENESIELTLDSTTSNSTYLWSLDGSVIHQGSQFLISESGVYTVKVTSPEGCSSEEQFIVVRPPFPIIKALEYGSDYIVVTAVGGNNGYLEYSLNQVLWQDSPRFNHLESGKSYTVYVRENGCKIASYMFTLLTIPNFISPNGDGMNDVLMIRGIHQNPTATIKIFDRYGKVFVNTNFSGNYVWDGRYLGRNVPSGDYWYIIEAPTDGVKVAQKWVGHISVRNQ